MPTYIISQSPHRVVLRNFEGVITTYSEPESYTDDCHCEACQTVPKSDGVAALLRGEGLSLEPANLERKQRSLKR